MRLRVAKTVDSFNWPYVRVLTCSFVIDKEKWHLMDWERMTLLASCCDNVCFCPLDWIYCIELRRPVANQDTSLVSEPTSMPSELKGYLNKYVNVARGYNARWFVLKDGVLSCLLSRLV